ncbi:MAG TPA: class I SAM-dependent methyltransferase [Solirubrobacteraceae bacterium]|jgi:SAM-dependent methyltransferase|nr:class I SAM-dependent methyltransferase [Solirubrobacteraceae bacterium]
MTPIEADRGRESSSAVGEQAMPVADEQASRIEREKEFYNEKASTSYAKVRRWIWRAIGEFRRNEDLGDYYDPAGKTVLDYGCGPGYLTTSLFERGAEHVTGIDVSEGEVEQARESAAANGFAKRSRFVAGDAHATGFDKDSFDLIVGQAIIHHLDVEVSLRELRRILRPGGRAVFLEPLWHNPILRVGRLLTPTARTPDEHPLTTADWELCASIFDGFRHYERELVTMPLMPLNLILPQSAQRRLASPLRALDDYLLARFPALRKYARLTILVLE